MGDSLEKMVSDEVTGSLSVTPIDSGVVLLTFSFTEADGRSRKVSTRLSALDWQGIIQFVARKHAELAKGFGKVIVGI